jgi:hypothetical protein
MDGITLMQQLAASGLQAVVLDFDCTITREHTGGGVSSSELQPEHILSNVYNLQHFREFVATAQQLGLQLCVATFADRWSGDVGGEELVLRYMDILLGKERGCLRGRGDIAAWYKEGLHHKQRHLQFLREQYKWDPGYVLVIDDDQGGTILPVAAKDGYITAKAVDGLRKVVALTYTG